MRAETFAAGLLGACLVISGGMAAQPAGESVPDFSGTKRLNVLFTVDDPGAFTKPWSARADYRPDDWFFEENVCAGNNRPTSPAYEIPIPVADKPDF